MYVCMYVCKYVCMYVCMYVANKSATFPEQTFFACHHCHIDYHLYQFHIVKYSYSKIWLLSNIQKQTNKQAYMQTYMDVTPSNPLPPPLSPIQVQRFHLQWLLSNTQQICLLCLHDCTLRSNYMCIHRSCLKKWSCHSLLYSCNHLWSYSPLLRRKVV